MAEKVLGAILAAMLVTCGGNSLGSVGLKSPSSCLPLHGPLRLRGGSSAELASPCDFDSTPCIGAISDFSALERFYSSGDSNEVFRRKLIDLKAQYPVGYRPVKGDGNCFIRGYVFGLLEGLLDKPSTEAAGFRGTCCPALR